MRIRSDLALFLAALAVAAACAGGDGGRSVATTPSTSPVTTSPSTPSGTTAAEPGSATTGAGPHTSADALFAFEAPQVTGGTYDGSRLSGRDVAIWFWAPW